MKFLLKLKSQQYYKFGVKDKMASDSHTYGELT